MSNAAKRNPWWKSGVVYQIYPRSFADGNGDGVGDLAGLRARLDHLVWLGVDAIWLSPIYPSPMADFGYDVSDYCDVDPVFGSLAELDALVADAHARGLRVILDWVPNHTSDRHPWFVESRASRTSPKRDWYLWRDPKPGGAPPNNWKAAFARDQPAWTLDPATGQMYLHLFLPQQPDLDWANPEVQRAMQGVLRFWLDRGIDGFRMDVIHCIGKSPGLPDDAPPFDRLPHVIANDTAETHVNLRALRLLLDGYPGERMMVGEVVVTPEEQVFTYYGQDDELHLAFDLPHQIHTPWDAAAWAKRIGEVGGWLAPRGGWPAWVLSNHDNPRHRTRYGAGAKDAEARARASAVLLLTLRGTPFLYAGEELGLEDATIPPERIVDPGGRDGCRAPLPWDAAAPHGWGRAPWLPFAPDPGARSAEALRADPRSILHLYRRLLAARRASAALHAGDLALLPAPEGVLAYARTDGADRRLVLVNFTDEVRSADARGVVEIASDGAGEGDAFRGALAPSQALLLRP
jgi:alpha-glucosidase